MKKQFLLFAFTVVSTMLFSQAQNMAFEDFKTNDGTQNFFYKNIVKTDASGNIYTLGATTTSNSTTDILLSKKNSSGVTLWTKQINGTANYHDFGAGMVITSGGDVYITGAITNNTTTLAPDLILRKYNSSGTQQFSSTYAGAGYGAVGKDIVLDASSNSYITGAEYNSSLSANILTISFNSSGSQRWATLFDYNGLNDGGVKIATKSTNVTVTGAVTQGTNSYKIATLSFTAATGAISETVTTGSTMTSSVEIVTGMTTDASGNTYICGATEVSGQGYNMYVAKLTSSLTIAWQQTYNGSSNLDDQAKGIQVDASGNVYITGYSTSSTLGKEIRTIKYNSSGTLQWNNVINSTGNNADQAYDMEIDASSNIYVVGSIASDINQLDYYTVKYNSSGTKIWDIQTDGSHLNDQATNVTLDSLNNVIVTGESETMTNTYVYTTVKYVQKDIIVPTDFNGESPNNNIMFYKNKGQLINTSDSLIPDIKYYTNNTYPSLYFKEHAQSFIFSKIDTIAATVDTLHRVDLTFNGVNESSKTYPLDQQEKGFLNYYLGHLDSNGVVGVLGNKRLITTNIYNNIDLMTTSNQNGIKYYFIVKPGADMRDIQMEFTGATSFSLNGTTNYLSVNSNIGQIIFDKPIAYQLTSSNSTVAVTSFSPTWTTNGASNKYKFNNGTYTSSLTLIVEVDQGNGTLSSTSSVDNLYWSSYYGTGGGRESGQSIKNDNSGNIYLGGFSNNPTFPTTTGAYQTAYLSNDLNNGILIKFNSSRQRQWSTYYGGSSEDQIKSISFDNTSSQIYACGHTWSSDFPTKNKGGANVSPSFQGGVDGFVASFKSFDGFQTWSNLIGTSGDDRGYSMHIDNSGNKYIVGYTSTGLSLTNVASYYMQNTYGGGASDGFILHYNSTDQLRWLTYYGGNDVDYPKSVTTDVSGNIIVWGQTNSTTFNTYNPDPIGNTAIYTTANAGFTDFFIVKFNSSGSRLWSTLYGGDSDDWAADGDGIVTVGNDIFCFGTTSSTNLPIKQFGSTATYNLNGPQDCYIVCFNSSYQKKWATYYGGSDADWANGITKDANNNIFTTGGTSSSDYLTATQTGFYHSSFNGGAPGIAYQDVFVTAYANNSYAPVWSTFMGGNLSDAGNSLSLFGTKLFMTGESLSYGFNSNIPFQVVDPGNSAYQYTPISNQTGNGDIIIAEFNVNNMSTQVGIKEINNHDFGLSVFPNPFASEVSINGLSEKMTTEIYDALGKLVVTDMVKPEKNIVNLTILNSGVYFMKIINLNGNYKTYKIIKN